MFCSLHSVHLLCPVCLQRFLAGTVQSSFAAGCYSGSLWRESLDTFKKKNKTHTQLSLSYINAVHTLKMCLKRNQWTEVRWIR